MEPKRSVMEILNVLEERRQMCMIVIFELFMVSSVFVLDLEASIELKLVHI